MELTEIKKEGLEDLYLKKRLSTYKIAKRIKISREYVRLSLKKFNIPRRANSEAHLKYTRFPFFGNSEEKAYLLGLRAGDISARKHYGSVLVETASTKEAQLEMFRRAFSKYGHISYYKKEGKFGIVRRIYSYLDHSFQFLKDKPKVIPLWILKKEELFYNFLAGYSDSESFWSIKIKKHKKYIYKELVYQLDTSDKPILKQIYEKFKKIGFHPRFYLAKKANIKTDIEIRRDFDLYRTELGCRNEVIKLAKILLPLTKHPEKLFKMEKIITLEHSKHNKGVTYANN